MPSTLQIRSILILMYLNILNMLDIAYTLLAVHQFGTIEVESNPVMLYLLSLGTVTFIIVKALGMFAVSLWLYKFRIYITARVAMYVAIVAYSILILAYTLSGFLVLTL